MVRLLWSEHPLGGRMDETTKIGGRGRSLTGMVVACGPDAWRSITLTAVRTGPRLQCGRRIDMAGLDRSFA